MAAKAFISLTANVVRGCELDLLGERDLAEKGADMSGMLLGQIEIRKAIGQRRVVQLYAAGRVHGRQDGCQMLAHNGRKVIVSGRRHKLPPPSP
ncbi:MULTISPECIES: hypothetical protein [unclassified Mesorhizobium]|uniref:hypothetical protein n=1 Tax=unclassified Mesorhizobium TaxID=325217 RepID=UPI0016725D96|nr:MULTISPECIES: hypothetical protein [unclassified Mesorhizobium]